MFISKSRENAASVSLILNPETNFVSSNFHIVHYDNFQTIVSNANNLPPNWKEIFDTDHYANDENFTVPLKATLPNSTKSTTVKIGFNDDAVSTAPQISEGDSQSNVSEGATINAEEISNASEGANIDIEGEGSIAQNIVTKSGRMGVKPTRYLQLAMLGLLSCETKYPINTSADLHSVSIFRAQMDYDEISNTLPDETFNQIHLLSLMAS